MVHGGYIALERDRPLIRVPFTHLSVGTVLLALTGLIISLVLSLMYHYSESTYTHCMVDNYLPSISASISLVPERYIWRTCIGLHSAPRYLTTASYCMFYWRRSGSVAERLLTAAVCVCSLAENTGLLLLTYVSSTETYKVHKNSFIVFIGGSLLHMLFTCRLWYSIQKYSLNTEEKTSYRWKLRLFLFNVSCCVAAGYFFRRHNKFCEPGIYTVFALLEYLVVGSNMAFHLTAFWDFSNQEVLVATPPEDKRY